MGEGLRRSRRVTVMFPVQYSCSIAIKPSLDFDFIIMVSVVCAGAVAGTAGDAAGTLGQESSVGMGMAEQQLNSAMQQLGVSDGE